MKYILIALLLVGCTNSPKPTEIKELNNHSGHFDQQYNIYTFQGCEYIVVDQGAGRWGSHKGNCKNPIHYEHSK